MVSYYAFDEPDAAPSPTVEDPDDDAPPPIVPDYQGAPLATVSNYDTMGNYGTGYGAEPQVAAPLPIPPNPYVSSDYDAQGQYGAGYGHSTMHLVPQLTSVGHEDVQWHMRGAPGTPAERVTVETDGSLRVQPSHRGYLSGSTMPPNGMPMPTYGGLNTAVPMPTAGRNAYQPYGPLHPGWETPRPLPFPGEDDPFDWDAPTFRDIFDDEDLPDY